MAWFWQSKNAVDPAVETAGDDVNNGALEVVEDITLGQILDAFNGSGDDWFNYYSPSFYGRNSAIDYIALTRATTLIAQVASFLISNGYYRICDDTGETVNDDKAKALREVLSYTFAGRWGSSTSIQDAMIDYLIEGNFLFFAKTDYNGRVQSLHRLIPWSVTIQDQTTHGDIYRGILADVYDSAYRTFEPSDTIIHGRWPQLRRIYGNGGDRQFFARPPVSLMRPAISAGRAIDNYVRKFAERAPAQTLATNFAEEVTKLMTAEQREAVRLKMSEQQRKALGNIVLQDWSVTDITRKIDPNLVAIREFQRSEVAAFYGIPAPLMGVNVTQWGQGIAELGRLAKNYAFMLHIQNFLDPIAFKLLKPGCHIEIDYYKLLQADPVGVKNLIDAGGGHSHRPPVLSQKEQRKLLGFPAEVDGELAEWHPPNTPVPADDADAGDDGDKSGDGNDDAMRLSSQNAMALISNAE